jgi:hypothetical protein
LLAGVGASLTSRFPSTPLVTTGVVGVVGVVGDVTTAVSELATARVRGPKNPDAGVTPFEIWYATTADLVRGPKDPLATPAGIVRRPFDSRNDCRATTSAPREPSLRFVLKAFVIDCAEAATGATTESASAKTRAAVRIFFIYIIIFCVKGCVLSAIN